ncbi:hypothetical protein GCM10010310_68560 [Streptomyces violaceolatus]|uniref:Translation initiation factor IF-2 n=1 Tax=Streptomyces violaceolatus TaxID=67378 RepID=A0ABN3TF55_9ACTN
MAGSHRPPGSPGRFAAPREGPGAAPPGASAGTTPSGRPDDDAVRRDGTGHPAGPGPRPGSARLGSAPTAPAPAPAPAPGGTYRPRAAPREGPGAAPPGASAGTAPSGRPEDSAVRREGTGHPAGPRPGTHTAPGGTYRHAPRRAPGAPPRRIAPNRRTNTAPGAEATGAGRHPGPSRTPPRT